MCWQWDSSVGSAIRLVSERPLVRAWVWLHIFHQLILLQFGAVTNRCIVYPSLTGWVYRYWVDYV